MLATIAIGEQYLQPFMKYAYHTWEMYCHRHDLGLILFDEDLISPDHPKWKKATWQKYLIGEVVSNSNLKVENVCYLDTDILISPIAPNIFDHHKKSRVSLVSQWYNLPYERQFIARRIAFLRNRFLSSDYPLDSLLFASIDQFYNFSSLPAQTDYACAGLFVFNAQEFSRPMSNFFHSYDTAVLTPSAGGDQLHFNYFVQSNAYDQWLPYEFQALWIFEVPIKYPFLFSSKKISDEQIRQCIEASLFSNYFLHFAGSWNESMMWKQVKVFESPDSLEMFKAFDEYMRVPVYGKPLGTIKPKEIS